MEEIEDYLINKLNYDVVTIIMDKVYKLNYTHLLSYCNIQLLNINKEYHYLMEVYKRHQRINKPPEYVRMFILMKNREKISTNYTKTKRDQTYNII